MFRAASDDDIEEYSDSVTCFIRTCIEDVIPTKTTSIYPNQKPWINSDVRSALSARTSAFKSGNTDDRKQASYDLRRSIKAAKRQYKNKVEEQFFCVLVVYVYVSGRALDSASLIILVDPHPTTMPCRWRMPPVRW